MISSHPNLNTPAPASLAAMVLAAGASSRMGVLKPLLRLAGVTALERSLGLFREAGIDDVLVVLGHRASELRPLVEQCGARWIENPHPDDGMYSSVAAGARSLASSARGVFVLPADVPLVRPATIRQIAAAFLNRPSGIVYPVFGDRRGHPPLIARAILDQAANGATGPLRTLLALHEPTAMNIPVADEAIHLDMDTPADFDRLQALAARREIPTPAECEAILARERVSESVVRHARKVAEIAAKIANALAATGLAIDPELVRAGALLHDVAKGQANHADVGAAAIRADGLATVADIVAAHTTMEFANVLDERAIVYLADKLTAGDLLVTLDERFAAAEIRFQHNAEARKAAEQRKAVAQQIAAAIEAKLGEPLIRILRDGSDAKIPKEGRR